MGAGCIYIVKSWLGEIYFNVIDEGVPVLKYELAHVFGVLIAEGWLGIPIYLGVLFWMVIVEGFVVVLIRDSGCFSLYQWILVM